MTGLGGIFDKLSECLTINSSLCSRVRHKKSTCNNCEEICQQQAIRITSVAGKVLIDFVRCNGCGKCVVVCPNRVFSLKKTEMGAFWLKCNTAVAKKQTIKIACSSCEFNNEDIIVIRTLAYVDRFALVKLFKIAVSDVVLINGDCDSCKHQCFNIAKNEVFIVNKIMKKGNTDKSVDIVYYKDLPAVKTNKNCEQLTRREFFSFLRKKAEYKMGEMLYSINESSLDDSRTLITGGNISDYKDFHSFIQAIEDFGLVEELNDIGAIHFAKVDRSVCTLCGICQRVCPFGVINLTETTLNGQTKYTDIFVNTDSCSGCNLCLLVCPTKALTVK